MVFSSICLGRGKVEQTGQQQAPGLPVVIIHKSMSIICGLAIAHHTSGMTPIIFVELSYEEITNSIYWNIPRGFVSSHDILAHLRTMWV